MRYDICLQSFVNTDGFVLGTAVNVFNGTLKSRQEAGAMTLQVLNDAHAMFCTLPDFEIEGAAGGVEIHMIVRAAGQTLIKIDAVPARLVASRGEKSKDSIVLPAASRLLN